MSASDVDLHVLERVNVTDPNARLPPGIEPWQLDLARLLEIEHALDAVVATPTRGA